MIKTESAKRVVIAIDRFESILLLLLISVLFYLVQPIRTEKNLKLRSRTPGKIITQLQNRGYSVAWPDTLILRMLGRPGTGWVYLGHERMSRLDFLHRLASADRFVRITLIPGETSVLFFDQMGRRLHKDPEKLFTAYRALSPYPEGGILAESYNVPLRYDARQAVQYLVNLSEKRFHRLARENGIAYTPQTWLRILTIASIVQKEAANRSEMPVIASVIYNRLKKRMRLQMDGSLNYGRYSHIRVTPRRIREDNSSYNTYRHRGLPAAPVCNVSAAAIRAALHPARTDFLYFFRNDRGTHDFFRNYRAHLREVRTKRRELREEKKHMKSLPRAATLPAEKM